MRTVEVIAPGSTVIIGDNIEGTIAAVTLRDQCIIYEVTWWDGRILRSGWLQPQEIKATDKAGRIQIGFGGRS